MTDTRAIVTSPIPPKFPRPFPFLPASEDDPDAARIDAYRLKLVGALLPKPDVYKVTPVQELVRAGEQAIEAMPKQKDHIDWYYCASLQGVLGMIWFAKGYVEAARDMYKTAFNTLDWTKPSRIKTKEQRIILRQKMIEIGWQWDKVERACESIFAGETSRSHNPLSKTQARRTTVHARDFASGFG